MLSLISRPKLKTAVIRSLAFAAWIYFFADAIQGKIEPLKLWSLLLGGLVVATLELFTDARKGTRVPS